MLRETYPELYGVIGVHSGRAYGSANDAMSAFAVMREQAGPVPAAFSKPQGVPDAGPRLIGFHGSADSTVPPSNAERIIARKGGHGGQTARSEAAASGDTRGYTRLVTRREDGTHGTESWMIDGAPHA